MPLCSPRPPLSTRFSGVGAATQLFRWHAASHLLVPAVDHWLAPTFHALSGAARALVADVPAAADGGAASGGCPPEVEAALDSAMPDEIGGPDELIVWVSNQSYAGVSWQGERPQRCLLVPTALRQTLHACLATPLTAPQGMVRGYTKLFGGDGACFGPAAIGVEVSKEVLEGVPGPDGASMQPPPECKT